MRQDKLTSERSKPGLCQWERLLLVGTKYSIVCVSGRPGTQASRQLLVEHNIPSCVLRPAEGRVRLDRAAAFHQAYASVS
jgi:hypothetical protein